MRLLNKGLLVIAFLLVASHGSANAALVTLNFNSAQNQLLPHLESGFEVLGLGGPGDEGVADNTLYDNDLGIGEIIRFRLTGDGTFSFQSFDLFTGFLGELHSSFRFSGRLNGVETWSSAIFAEDASQMFKTFGGYNTDYFDEFRIVGMGRRHDIYNLAIWDSFVFDVLRDGKPATQNRPVPEPVTTWLIIVLLGIFFRKRFINWL